MLQTPKNVRFFETQDDVNWPYTLIDIILWLSHNGTWHEFNKIMLNAFIRWCFRLSKQIFRFICLALG